MKNIIKSILMTALACVAFTSCSNNTFTLDLTVSQKYSNDVKYLVYKNCNMDWDSTGRVNPIDTLVVKDGKCSFRIDVDEVTFGAIRAIHKDGTLDSIPTGIYFIPGEHAVATIDGDTRDLMCHDEQTHPMQMKHLVYENTSDFYKKWNDAMSKIKPLSDAIYNGFNNNHDYDDMNVDDNDDSAIQELVGDMVNHDVWSQQINRSKAMFEHFRKDNNNPALALYICGDDIFGFQDMIGYTKMYEAAGKSLKNNMFGAYLKKYKEGNEKHLEELKRKNPDADYFTPGEFLDYDTNVVK